jgi:lipoprotein-anchoring transpeptidase ErfK/SrfK
MNDRFIQSREALSYAREALKNGSNEEARRWAQRAAELAPQSEDPWLVLATVAKNPQDSVNYVRKALELNPESSRAKKGMEWAMQRAEGMPQGENSPGKAEQAKVTPEPPKKSTQNESVKIPKKKSKLLPILLIMMGCAVFAFAAWSAVNSPVLASILNIASAPKSQASHGPLFAHVAIAKPTYTPGPQQPGAEVVILPATVTPTTVVVEESQPEIVSDPPTLQPTVEVVILPTDTPVVESASPTAEVTGQPGMVYAEIIADTPTPEYTAPTAVAYVPPVAGTGGEHWIDVNLSEQRVYAYEGDTVVNSFIVSTGTWQTPTVTGKYHIWIKLLSTTMTGPGYYLPNVPYTMYFYKGYGLHGTYWHNNFGTPMSHGCVNLRTDDAEWLYNFSSVGTLVNVHY